VNESITQSRQALAWAFWGGAKKEPAPKAGFFLWVPGLWWIGCAAILNREWVYWSISPSLSLSILGWCKKRTGPKGRFFSLGTRALMNRMRSNPKPRMILLLNLAKPWLEHFWGRAKDNLRLQGFAGRRSCYIQHGSKIPC